MNILVTGGAGYIGSVLTTSLVNDNHNVTCIDNLLFNENFISDLSNFKNYEFIKQDINNHDAIKEILEKNQYDVVIHLAAIVGDPACKLYRELAIKTNLTSTKWLIDQSIINGVKQFIFASTCSNYGKMSTDDNFVNETSLLAPVSLYAELKVEIENYLLNDIQKVDSFTPTSLRFATVYGLSPRMRFDLTVNEFVRELTLGRTLEVFGEQFWRPYCHVKDFTNAFECILNSSKEKTAYNVFNVGKTEENYTKKMIVERISKYIPDIKINYVPQVDDPRDYRVNFEKIKKLLGFVPEFILDDGIIEIKDTIETKKIIDPDSQIYSNTPKK